MSLEIYRDSLRPRDSPVEALELRQLMCRPNAPGRTTIGRFGALVFQGWYRTTPQGLKLQRSVLTAWEVGCPGQDIVRIRLL